ncbi:MAG: hypothetical protein HZB98_01840 [Bacteroidia bacterium]|nr:hypothetical protein [Bacteroidia bacterium]
MDKRISDSIPGIIAHLRQKPSSEIKAFLGFDACIDNIMRVVKEKHESGDIKYFSESKEFGVFIVNRNNRSCGIELETHRSKTGGNMVITANALGNLGIKTDCLGTFGLPEILPAFRTISPNCNLYSIGNTISATALEFSSSKLILFDPGPYRELTWQGIKKLIGPEKLIELISGKQLVSFLNWSEIENSSEIWKGFIEEIFPAIEGGKVRSVFLTDLSDCSRRTRDEICNATKLLSSFRKFFKTVLSLNQNEAELVAKAKGLSYPSAEEDFIKMLFGSIEVDLLVIHRIKDALAYDGKQYERCCNFYCNDPSVLTGGGDNFNAGLCYALLNNFDLCNSLITANAVSGSYVQTGISPGHEELIEFLSRQ